MPYTFQVTIDCRDPHRLADWWADALGWEVSHQDPSFIRKMIEEGHASESDTTTHNGELVWKEGAAIVHPDGVERAPRVYFQRVPERKVSKNRIHLDVRMGSGSVAEVVERLKSAGATVLHEGSQGPHTWTTLADPEGNEFCLSH